jgi:glutaminyl-tRNA synthetase
MGRYAFPIKCTEVVLADDNKSIVEIRAEYDPSKKTKPKVFFLSFHGVIC